VRLVSVRGAGVWGLGTDGTGDETVKVPAVANCMLVLLVPPPRCMLGGRFGRVVCTTSNNLYMTRGVST